MIKQIAKVRFFKVQKEITKVDNLLEANGHLKNVGYAKKMILKYNREDIAKKGRIKEWDYYYVSDNHYALCLTISNLSYAAVLSASVIDFYEKKHYDKTSIKFFPKNTKFMPTTSFEGSTVFETAKANFTFDVNGATRTLKGKFFNFFSDNGLSRDLEFNITIDDVDPDSMVKATPFKRKHHFYYNQKKNCMPARGIFTFKGKNYVFDESVTLATLDWGRGVLPYNTHWYWANIQTRVGDTRIGLNLGRAFGSDEDACENMIFLNGVAHKLEDVKIYIGKKNLKRDYLNPWTFYTSDGRVELVFEPFLDRYDPFYALVLKFVPHQVFGRFSGQLTLDDGKKIKLENIIGFAERVENRW